MSFSGLDEKLPPALIAIGIRILGGALLGLFAVWIFEFKGLTAVMVIASAAAPVGASAAAIASVSGLNRSVAINAVSLSALIGLFTTSALLYLTSTIFG
jgi:predicted permease